MSDEFIKLQSSDNEIFEFKKSFVPRAHMLRTMLNDLAIDLDSPTTEPVPLNHVTSASLKVIISWLNSHEKDEEPTEDEVIRNRHNRRLSNEDRALFDTVDNRADLAKIINAAYFLEIPGLIETLVRYVSHHLDRKSAEEMAAWLNIPMQGPADARPAPSNGEDADASQAKRERVDDAPAPEGEGQ